MYISMYIHLYVCVCIFEFELCHTSCVSSFIHMCSFIVLMPSVRIHNVSSQENGRETILLEGLSKPLTSRVLWPSCVWLSIPKNHLLPFHKFTSCSTFPTTAASCSVSRRAWRNGGGVPVSTSHWQSVHQPEGGSLQAASWTSVEQQQDGRGGAQCLWDQRVLLEAPC